ncbi:MAG: hypothetical protein PHV18_06245 [Lachnospiraceae bacterium]|nr:hypothetical protein [Lachnospiraceae bacterium]
MRAQFFHNMSSDFTVYQSFSALAKNAPDCKTEFLTEQIAWTEEQIAQLEQRLEQLQCLLDYQVN